jgi:hypothetical protein
MMVKESPIQRPRACYCVGAMLLLYLCIGSGILIAVHLNRSSFLPSDGLFRAHVMCGGFGMVGASMAALRKFYRALITETTNHHAGGKYLPTVWDFGWVVYYITRPLLGGVLGGLMFTLTFVGFQILATPQTVQISPQGRYALYAVAFFAGYSVSHVLDRLNTFSKHAFNPKDNRRS